MNKVSVIYVGLGEPDRLIESIESISDFASEIIVIDIGLSDSMKKKLLNIPNLLLIPHEKVSHVELLRNKSINYATSDYVFILDPDEVVPSTLKAQLLENFSKYDYIQIPRKNIIFQKWIEHARWWPDYQTRLFKKGHVIWSEEIHKQPELVGNGLTLEAKEEYALTHYNYTSIDEYLTKMFRYAKVDATTNIEKNFTLTLGDSLQKGVQEFISRFFAGEGYKDGMHGFVLSFLQLIYYPLVYFYYWEGKKYENVEEKIIMKYTQIFIETLQSHVRYWLGEKHFISSFDQLKNKISKKILGENLTIKK